MEQAENDSRLRTTSTVESNKTIICSAWVALILSTMVFVSICILYWVFIRSLPSMEYILVLLVGTVLLYLASVFVTLVIVTELKNHHCHCRLINETPNEPDNNERIFENRLSPVQLERLQPINVQNSTTPPPPYIDLSSGDHHSDCDSSSREDWVRQGENYTRTSQYFRRDSSGQTATSEHLERADVSNHINRQVPCPNRNTSQYIEMNRGSSSRIKKGNIRTDSGQVSRGKESYRSLPDLRGRRSAFNVPNHHRQECVYAQDIRSASKQEHGIKEMAASTISDLESTRDSDEKGAGLTNPEKLPNHSELSKVIVRDTARGGFQIRTEKPSFNGGFIHPYKIPTLVETRIFSSFPEVASRSSVAIEARRVSPIQQGSYNIIGLPNNHPEAKYIAKDTNQHNMCCEQFMRYHAKFNPKPVLRNQIRNKPDNCCARNSPEDFVHRTIRGLGDQKSSKFSNREENLTESELSLN